MHHSKPLGALKHPYHKYLFSAPLGISFFGSSVKLLLHRTSVDFHIKKEGAITANP